MPGGSPSLLRIPDTELLNILKITYEVIGNPHKSRSSIHRQQKHQEALVAEPTEPCTARQIKWIQIILMQTCQITLSPASTKQQMKE